MSLGSASQRAQALLARSGREFFDDRCPLIAAAIAYYVLFSLFPLAILLVGASGIVTDEAEAREAVIDFLLDNLPLEESAARADLQGLLRSVTDNAAAFGVVGVGGLVFAASGLMGAIRKGVSAAFDSSERRPPLVGKLVDFLLVLLVGLIVAASLGLTVAASIVDLPVPLLPRVIPAAVSFVVFAGLYRLLPPRRPRLQDVWPGALLATAGYELAKEGFSLYLGSFSSYGAIYGSLGAVIALLVFAFLAANIFLFGAEAAAEWGAVRKADLDELDDGVPISIKLRRALRGLVSSSDRGR